MCEIHINLKEKALVRSKDGEVIRPSCWYDLISYHSYLIDTSEEKEAKELLKKVFKGEKVISDMIRKNQERSK